MIQKKVCMVGVFGTGKTCLVQQYVHSLFTTKYHSTVGVKIDRKSVTVDGTDVTVMLWDLAGRDDSADISVSYLRGGHGIIYVVDGTRRETFDQIFELRTIVHDAIGDVPSVLALNKVDLTGAWALTPADDAAVAKEPWHVVRTSAKSGEGVNSTFAWLAKATLAGSSR